MEGMLRSLGKSVLVVLAAAFICVFFILSPLISCDGRRQHCGERVWDAVPYVVLASPIILILVALFFFPSRSKDLLATLAVVVAGYLALFGLMATADYLIRPRHVEQPAEKAEKSQAASRYTLCLEVTAGALAQTSKDPPSVIAHTSRASCEKERHEIFDTFIKYGDNVSPAAITDLQRAFWLKLPQIIAKARG